MNICVFCSSSHNLDAVYLESAEAFGRALAKHGHTMVFGGYDLGLMGATASAAVQAGGRVIGVTTAGLSSGNRTVVQGIEEIETADLAQRKNKMMELSDAFVSLPGGIGTLDEFFSVIARVKAHELDAKSALLNVAGFYDPLVQMLDEACAKGLNSNDWHEIGGAFEDADELLAWLEE